MNPTSCARSVGVIGLAIAPQRQIAQHRTTASHQFGSCQPTTSPGRTPQLARARRATRADRARRSSTVRRVVTVDDRERVRRRPTRAGRAASRRSRCRPPRQRACRRRGAGCAARTVTARRRPARARAPSASSSRTAAPTSAGLPPRALVDLRAVLPAVGDRDHRRPRSRTRGRSRRATSALPSHTTSGEMLRGIVDVEARRRAPACARRTPLRSCACGPPARSRWRSRRSGPSRPPRPA